jgi:hypothetical protein
VGCLKLPCTSAGGSTSLSFSNRQLRAQLYASLYQLTWRSNAVVTAIMQCISYTPCIHCVMAHHGDPGPGLLHGGHARQLFSSQDMVTGRSDDATPTLTQTYSVCTARHYTQHYRILCRPPFQWVTDVRLGAGVMKMPSQLSAARHATSPNQHM